MSIYKVLEHYGWKLPPVRPGWVTVRCGVHDDSHKSCCISDDANYVKCMACDFAGDDIEVVKHYEGVGYKDAVTVLEGILGGSNRRVPRTGRTGRTVSRSQGSRPKGGGRVSSRIRGNTDGGSR